MVDSQRRDKTTDCFYIGSKKTLSSTEPSGKCGRWASADANSRGDGSGARSLCAGTLRTTGREGWQVQTAKVVWMGFKSREYLCFHSIQKQ